jgi:probable rRNA maturation factor
MIEVTFLSSQRMRALNRRAFGRDRATDVIAFGMRHGELLVGDVYVCPEAARRSAGREGVPVREELVRLVVHGTLHALGQRHPEGAGRSRSRMWRRQESYVAALRRRA